MHFVLTLPKKNVVGLALDFLFPSSSWSILTTLNICRHVSLQSIICSLICFLYLRLVTITNKHLRSDWWHQDQGKGPDPAKSWDVEGAADPTASLGKIMVVVFCISSNGNISFNYLPFDPVLTFQHINKTRKKKRKGKEKPQTKQAFGRGGPTKACPDRPCARWPPTHFHCEHTKRKKKRSW